MTKRFHRALFAALAALPLAATSARANDNFGAIAYSPKSGSWGSSYDYPSRRAAEQRSLDECGKHSSDCEVLVWFRNACGALAVGSKGYGTGWGTERNIAEDYAMQVCGKHSGSCSIKMWVCTTR